MEKELKTVFNLVLYSHNPIMQYSLGVLYIKTIQVASLLLGLYHASVNWISIVLMQID